ncbi:MAG: Transport permease protein [Candidatus Poribacteria bacterium]|nr:Transport permease protein [Candidatus Poribacteria bacterium]
MRTILHIVKKEFLQVARDRAFLPLLLLAPILQSMLFGYTVATDVKNISTAVLDQDKTQDSRKFTDSFSNSGYFRLKYYLQSGSEIENLLDSGKVKLVINVPKGFSRSLKRSEPIDIQVIVDGSNSNTANVVLGYTKDISQRTSLKIIVEQLKNAKTRIPIVDSRFRAWYNPELRSVNFIVPGIICTVIAIVTTMLTSAAIVREREKGTLEQLMVSPIKPYQLILGKVLPFLLVGFVDAVVVLLVCMFWFKVPIHGSITLLLFLAIIFLSNTLGMGILISTVSRTQQQAMMTTLFLMIPWIILSGFIFPIENMPMVIQLMTYLIPLRYFLIIIRDIVLKGVGLSVFWPQVAALVILGTAILTLSISRFHKRLE